MTKLVIKTNKGWVKADGTFTDNFKEALVIESYAKALPYANEKVKPPFEIQPLKVLNGSFWNRGNN